MATAPVKSQPLHYFSLPQLKWHTNKTHTRKGSPPCSSDKQKEHQHEEEEEKMGCEEGEVRLWNLRPRKSVETVSLKKVEMRVESSTSNHVQRSQRLKDNNNLNGNGVGSGKMKGKRKLWISLSKEEIEEDVYSMTGSRPSRRPKKRSKIVQKQLDSTFPGLYLVGLTADSFKVNDTTK
ncbi:uncharacterized protein LOC132635144 [Lycium barbarum]|uniref:uncharacterized protein LOC132635144 n=1 Tax=Lycium barbarum TaxID=112863 RepID=UPI00293E96B9|nr:uncharacterized protein LOC132635144 [Lycium barbarum]